MKITWLAHASFLIEGDGLRIITDPYMPEELNLPPITEPADIVIRSSDDDLGHCYIDPIPTGYQLVTTTDIVDTGTTVKGLEITAIAVRESLIHKESPLDNAMYRFTLEGINITHMGDVGNRLSEDQLAAMAGTDVLLALTGGPPTLDLDDLYEVINVLKPRLVIPMHYRIPGPKFFMLPITDFTQAFPAKAVRWFETPGVELSRETLPAETQIYVLQPSLVGQP